MVDYTATKSPGSGLEVEYGLSPETVLKTRSFYDQTNSRMAHSDHN